MAKYNNGRARKSRKLPSEAPERLTAHRIKHQKRLTIDKRAKEIVSHTSGPRQRIHKLKTQMIKQGYHPKEDTLKRTQAMARDLMYHLGCEVQKFPNPNFSLVQSQTAEIDLQNPQLISEKEKFSVPSANNKPTDKFINQIDPFYDLDDQRPENILTFEKAANFFGGPDLTALASTMALYNIKFGTLPHLTYVGNEFMKE
tara:strand:+ start:366 stop:965 length:600 start_codon:yes stop_codon:yes gene_type:complete